MIFINYLLEGKKINGKYEVDLLQRLRDEIKKKWPHLARKKVFLPQANSPVYKYEYVIAMAKINELKFKLFLAHPNRSVVEDFPTMLSRSL